MGFSLRPFLLIFLVRFRTHFHHLRSFCVIQEKPFQLISTKGGHPRREQVPRLRSIGPGFDENLFGQLKEGLVHHIGEEIVKDVHNLLLSVSVDLPRHDSFDSFRKLLQFLWDDGPRSGPAQETTLQLLRWQFLILWRLHLRFLHLLWIILPVLHDRHFHIILRTKDELCLEAAVGPWRRHRWPGLGVQWSRIRRSARSA